MKQKKKARRPKDRSATENLLIEAAARVFAQHGFAGSTTRVIAEEAGVNLALIARYFGNKQGLLLSVIENMAADSEAEALPYPPQNNLKDECLCYADFHLSRMMEGIELLRIVIVESITNSEFAQNIREIEFLDKQEIHDRFKRFLKSKSEDEKEEKARLFIDCIDRAVFGTMIGGYLIEEKSKEKCAAELKDSLNTFISVFN